MARISLLVLWFALLGLVTPPAANAGMADTEVSVRVRTPVFELTADSITVPGYALSDEPGAPMLPLQGAVVELPPLGDWILEIASRDDRLLAERTAIRSGPSQARGQSIVVTSGESMAADGGVGTVEAPNPAIYGRDAFYPQSVAVAGIEQWQRGKRLLAIQIYPFQYNPVTHAVVYHPDITVTVRVSLSREARADGNRKHSGVFAQAGENVASELGALLLRTAHRGLHRLTYADLSEAGVPVAVVDPDSFQITYLGQPVQIQVTGAADAHFDPGDLVIFYAEPYVGRWMSSNVYRFAYGREAAPFTTRMTTRTVSPNGSEPVVRSGKQTLHIEANKAYYNDFDISTEADHIFDNPIYPTLPDVVVWPYDITFDDPAPGDMNITAQLYGGLDQSPNPDNWAKIQINDHDVGVYLWDGRTPYTVPSVSAPMSWLDQPANKLNFIGDAANLPGLSSYYYYVDSTDITYPAWLDSEDDRIEIPQPDVTGTAAQVVVTGFSTAGVRVYDVRNPRNPVQLLTISSKSVDGATQIAFWDAWSSSEPPPEYSLATDGALLPPVAVEIDHASSLKSIANDADYIAIVHRSLWDAVQPLLDRRIAQGLTVAKVDVQDIYDEFNYGRLHQNAIRDFLKYAYQNWNAGRSRPKYVVMVGDATPDYKGQLPFTMKNLVPAFLINIDPWLVETAADNRFVTFDGEADFMPEMIIGRISAQSPNELSNYVEKVAAYESTSTTPDGEWQNRVVYAADNDNNSAGNFHALSDEIRLTWLPPTYATTTVYYNPDNNPPGGYSANGDVRTNIREAFNDGAVFLQWFGHASTARWGSVSMWNIFDVSTLDANTRTPFVAGFSCVEGYFIYMGNNYQSLAEKHLMEQGRGSIGGLSPSGQHVGSALLILDRGLTKSFFQDKEAVIGDATDAARSYYYANSSAFMDVIDTSVLFGDPALKLRLPLPPPIAPEISIAGAVSSVDLTWSHLEPDTSYEVFRGTSPYFAPGAQGIQVGLVDSGGIGYTAGAPVTFTDTGSHPAPPVAVIGDAETSYFWVARGANWRGVSAASNPVGEFDYALTPGVAP